MRSLTRTLARAGIAASVLAFALGAQAQTTLRFGHANNAGEIAYDLFQEFADNVTKKTNGAAHGHASSRPSSSARRSTWCSR